MGAGAPGGRGPPGVRRDAVLAVTTAAVSPDTITPVPLDFALFRLARSMGIPPWVLEGHAVHEPPVEWVIRCLEFAAIEAKGSQVKRHG
jgi:hypothetical protein